jgi:endoglycosylceramidase
MKGPYVANTSTIRRSTRQLSRSLTIAVASTVLGGYAPTRGVSFETPRAPSPLTHSGRWLIDVQGRVVIVHGFNVVNKLAPYTPQSIGFDEDDAAFLESHGFNAVRLGVIWKAVEPLPGVYDAGYLAQMKATQQLLANHHIYSLIDWHQDEYSEVFGGEGFPEWAVDRDRAGY